MCLELEMEDGVECDECFDCSSSVLVLRRGEKRREEERRGRQKGERERWKKE